MNETITCLGENENFLQNQAQNTKTKTNQCNNKYRNKMKTKVYLVKNAAMKKT